MPKRKTPVEKPEDQFERFKKAAEQVDVEPEKVDKMFRRLAARDHKKDSESTR